MITLDTDTLSRMGTLFNEFTRAAGVKGFLDNDDLKVFTERHEALFKTHEEYVGFCNYNFLCIKQAIRNRGNKAKRAACTGCN
ncbi:MAG: hypothetical protein HQK96_17605 [Nitrospirae bacterium]|nr:hypothetical protein [Nitrospirota bacterium]